MCKNGKGMYQPDVPNYVYVKAMLIKYLLFKIHISQGYKTFGNLCLKYIYIQYFFCICDKSYFRTETVIYLYCKM